MSDHLEGGINALWQDIKSGDEQAFRSLIHACRPRLLLQSYYILSNIEEAEEVLQDVFVEIWMQRAKLNIHTSLEGYLSRAVTGNSLVRIKKTQVRQKRSYKYAYHIDPIVSNYKLENAEMGTIIMKAIEELPIAYRNIFKSVYLDGKTHREIVQEQKVGLQTVKNNISLALKVLRKKLEFLK